MRLSYIVDLHDVMCATCDAHIERPSHVYVVCHNQRSMCAFTRVCKEAKFCTNVPQATAKAVRSADLDCMMDCKINI